MVKKSLYYLIGILFFYSSISLAENLNISGSLVNSPCKLLPSDSEVMIKFENLILRELYENTAGWEKKEFIIALSECDLSVGSSFKIKFTGDDSPNLKGYLALDQEQFKNKLAIGIETDSGLFLPLNEKPSLIQIKNNGRNEIKFRAYLKPTAEAIANKNIPIGNFTAKVVFTLAYD
ncbi:fimbrial protein [Moellerella wisconsensis]|uniref:Minor fimbrial subunit n=1 Tax=Moellerella wisconsensis ATCC 35017 TaxID=1354267 RepID=A0A0N0Z9J1_9GAMM|nr:fimbrial protein [Moellerella wisconsensis]KPD03596.1 minor fimbrial subunit [Moellerella wisconsensis ATCC 35017]VFS50488.1 Fimbrial adapter papK precursor [Moellerella wisconsensis]